MAVKRVFTLVFPKKNNKILLGFKTRGIGCGLWNGFGGKLEENETLRNCAIRELREESSLEAEDVKHLGVVKYDVPNINQEHIVHIYTCHKFKGYEKCSEEMNPIKWYTVDQIPFNEMWPDAKEWYPFMVSEKFFSALVLYGHDGIIKEQIIEEHENLENALNLAL